MTLVAPARPGADTAEPTNSVGAQESSAPASQRRGARIAFAAVIVIAALGSLQRRVWEANDPQYLRAMVERVGEVGGTLYTSAVDHKGPLWIGVYRAAYTIAPGQQHYWWVIALITIATGAFIAAALASIGHSLNLPGRAVRFAAWLAFIYLVLGPEDLSGAFHARTLTAAMLFGAFAFVVRDLSLSRSTPAGSQISWRALIVSGFVIGLAVQTVLSAVLGSAVVALAIVALCWIRDRSIAKIVAFCGAGIAGLLSAWAWYALRGVERDFVDLWFTYNRTYVGTTGTTQTGIVRTGLGEIIKYYLWHIPHTVIIVSFVVLTLRRFDTLTPEVKVIRLATLTWWVAELAQLIVLERFFPYYWMAPLAPMLLMGVFVASDLVDSSRSVAVPETADAGRRTRRSTKLAVVASIIVGLLTVGQFGSGLRSIVGFDGFDDTHQDVLTEANPPRLAMRAITEAYVPDDEYAYLYVNFAGWFEYVDRTTASRFVPNRWLQGRVSGGSVTQDNLLPGTWDNFDSDLAATPASIVVEDLTTPIEPFMPLAERLERDFTPVLTSENENYAEALRIYLPNDVAIAPAVSDSRTIAVAEINGEPIECSVVQATVSASLRDGSGPSELYRLTQPDRPSQTLTIDGPTASTSIEGTGENLRVSSGAPGVDSTLTMWFGDDFVITILDDRIVAAHTFFGSRPRLHLGPDVAPEVLMSEAPHC